MLWQWLRHKFRQWFCKPKKETKVEAPKPEPINGIQLVYDFITDTKVCYKGRDLNYMTNITTNRGVPITYIDFKTPKRIASLSHVDIENTFFSELYSPILWEENNRIHYDWKYKSY